MNSQKDWDADLSPEEVKRLSPEQRSTRYKTSLLRKIEFLERNERNGELVKHSLDLAKNRTRLRKWRDSDRKMWAWTDPIFDTLEGNNKELMARWAAVLDRLRIRQDGGHHRAQLEEKDKMITALRAQVDQLVEQNRVLQKRYGHIARGPRQ